MDLAAIPGVGGLTGYLAGSAVKVCELDPPFCAFARRERPQLDIFTAVIPDGNLAVAVEGFDTRFRLVIRRIDDGPDDGNLAAMDFDVIHDEAVICPVIGHPLDLLPILVRLVRDKDLRTGRHRRYVRHIDLRAAIHIEELVVLRDGDSVIRDAALDLGIDIHIARGNEDVAICQDAAVFIDIVQIARVIERRAADVENAVLLVREGLDEVAILHLHIDRACVDGAVIVDVAILALHRDRAARVVDVARKRRGRSCVVRHIAILVVRWLEGILHRDGGRRCILTRRDSKTDIHALVLIFLFDRCLHISLELDVIIENRAALPGAIDAAAPDDLDIADRQRIRRRIRDGNRRIAPRVECTAARDIVPFKEDVTKLRRNVIDLHIVRHLLVDIFVKKIVRSLCVFWNWIAIGIDRDDRRTIFREGAIRIRAAIRVEFLRGRNLVRKKLLIPRDLLLPVDGSLFLLVDHFAFGIDGRTIILRHVRIDRITVVSIVLRDRIAVRLRAGIGCLLTVSHCFLNLTVRRRRVVVRLDSRLVCFTAFFVMHDTLIRRIGLNVCLYSLISRLLRQRRIRIVPISFRYIFRTASLFHNVLRGIGFCLFHICQRLQSEIIRMLGAKRGELRLLLIQLILIRLTAIGDLLILSLCIRENFLRVLELRRIRRGKLDESLFSFAIGLEISQPLRSHFFFKELNLCLIRSFGGIIRAEVSELLAKGGEALGELLPYDGSATIGIGNIAITLDRRLPAALLVLSADRDGLVSVNARLGLAVHSDICRRGDFLAADGAAVCPERTRHFVHPVLYFARTERREAARFRF